LRANRSCRTLRQRTCLDCNEEPIDCGWSPRFCLQAVRNEFVHIDRNRRSHNASTILWHQRSESGPRICSAVDRKRHRTDGRRRACVQMQSVFPELELRQWHRCPHNASAILCDLRAVHSASNGALECRTGCWPTSTVTRHPEGRLLHRMSLLLARRVAFSLRDGRIAPKADLRAD